MKMKYGLILATMLSASVMAQVATNNPPPMPVPGTLTPEVTPPPMIMDPPPATNSVPAKPVKKTAKKKDSTKKVAADKKKSVKPAALLPDAAPAAPLVANEPAVAKQNNVNVRGKAAINSEVIAHLKAGETVMVLEEVTLAHPKTDEPAKWARIALPAGTHVWVNGSFLDGTNLVVKPKKLNMRSGPGENFSVIGLLHKGDPVKTVETKGDWTEIEAPTNAFAFVAAHLLAHKDAVVAPPVVEPSPVAPPIPTPVPAIVENPPTIAAAPTTTPEMPPSTTPVVPSVPVITPPIPTPVPAPPSDEPPPKRIVQREGIVGGTVSIQAPTHYQLESLDNGKVIDYLYTTSTNVVLQRYSGLTVLVQGEEGLDERWPNTPVITIQKIQVVK
ncbi:MAG: type 3 domain protein [Pedosphaera sp.]|nr:type 3 domain protein [Pedosphaera sp.]